MYCTLHWALMILRFVFLNYSSYVLALTTGSTPITTRGTDVIRMVPCVACARVRRASRATRRTSSLAPSSPGVFPTPATDTITGQGSMADWSGTDSLAPPSPTPSRWGNRFVDLESMGKQVCRPRAYGETGLSTQSLWGNRFFLLKNS